MGKQRSTAPEESQGSLSDLIGKQLDPLRPIASEAFQETQKTEDYSQPRNLRAKDYRKYVPDLNPDESVESLNLKRAQNQSLPEQVGNALGQFVTGAVGGASMALGTSLDLEQSIKTIAGTEQEYSNLLYDFGKKTLEAGKNSMPIYQEDPNQKLTFKDSAYWLNMFGDTGLSLGIMGESALEAMAVSALTEGAGITAEIGAIGRKLRNIKSLEGLLSVGNNASKLKRAATTFAVINRQHESVMEAADAFETEYQALKGKGIEDGKAKEGAAKAAHATYMGNLPLMALDILQFRAMTFNPISGGSAGGIVENLLSKIPNAGVAKAVGMGVGIGSEGAEEFWQYLVQEESKNYADTVTGVGRGKDFQERFKEYSDKGEIWTASVSGLMGGVVLGGVSKGIQHFTEGNSKKNLDKQYNDFVNGISGIGSDLSNKIREAEEEGNEHKANNLRRNMGIQKALHAVHLDNLKDSDTAFSTYTTYLQGVLDAVNQGDTEQVKSLGIEGSEDFLKTAVPQYLADAEKIKGIYDEVKLTNSRDAVIPITYRRYAVDSLNDQLNTTKAQIEIVKASMPDLSNLSDPAAQLYEHRVNIKLYEGEIKAREEQLAKESDPYKKQVLGESIKDLQFNLNLNKVRVEEQEELIKVNGRPTDDDVLKSAHATTKLEFLKKQAIQVEDALNSTRRELNIWTDPEFQAKNRKGQLAEIISKARNTEELKSAEASLIKQGILTDEFRSLITEKRKVLTAQEEVETLRQQSTNAPESVETSPTPEVTPLSEVIEQTLNPAEPVIATPFGNVQPLDESDDVSGLELNPDRTSLGNSILPTAITEVPEVLEIDENTDDDDYTIADIGSLFDPAIINDNLTEDQKSHIKSKLGEYYNSLAADLGRKPTFKELVEDMINHTSAQQTERNFNVIKLGWELNEFPKTNFDKVYNELFGSRKSKADEFFNLANEVTTEEEFRTEQIQDTLKLEETLAPVAQIEETSTGEKVFIHVDPFVTVESTLKLAHLSIPYEKTMTLNGNGETEITYQSGEELNQGEYVDSKELMNPNLYHPGTKLSAQVAVDGDKMLIAQWDENYDKTKAIPFSQWAEGKDKNSDEYIGRMPMTIHNADDKAVAFVHDIEWYNPSNVGLGETPEKQKRIIAESREQLLEFRKAILANNGKLEINITEKRPGTKFVIPANQPLITLNEANPQAQIGFVTDAGNIAVGKTIISFDDLVNSQDLDRGHSYDLRQVGLTKEGKPQYFASKLQYEKITPEVKASIAQAMRVYSAQFDTKGDLMPVEQRDKVRKQVLEQTGIDLFDKAGIERYLNLFIPTVKTSAKNYEDIADNVDSNPNIPNLSPYIAIQGGAIVFGIKGKFLSGKNRVNYFYPGFFKGAQADKAAQNIITSLSRLYKDDLLGNMSPNITKAHLENNTNVPIIEGTGDTVEVKSKGTYQDYLKNTFKTNIKSFDLGDGTYATFIQPVIHFNYEAQKLGEIKEEVIPSASDIISQTASKITGNPIVAPEVNQEAEALKNILGSLEGFGSLGISFEALDILNNLGGEQPRFDPSYADLTDDIVKSIKTKLTQISDLDTVDRKVIVQFIANEVMNYIDPQKRNSVNKKELQDNVLKTFNDLIAPKVNFVNSKIADINKLYETGKYPQLKVVIDQLSNLTNNANVLKNNWNFLINEAFTDYIEKFTGISVTMSNDKSQVNIGIKSDEAVQDIISEEDDQQDFNIESNDQREKDHSKDSVEDNGKISVSYLVKRFLAQIPEYDQNNNPKTGFMGLTLYPGFDEYYGRIGQILSNPTSVGSDMKDIITRLQQHADSKYWVKELITRLENADEQLKNAFMYNFNRETLSMKFVMYSFDAKSQTYKLKVYDTNANEIIRVIQTQWKNNFNQSKLVKIEAGEYMIDTVEAKKLLEEYNSWFTRKKLPDEAESKAWLEKFGITLSNDAMHELFTNGYYVYEGGKSIKYPFTKMFAASNNTNGIMGLLGRKLQLMTSPNINLNFQENDTVNPFSDVNGVLGKLADLEAKFSQHVTTNSFRDGSKSVFGYTPSKFATTFLDRIKFDEKVLADKRAISFDSHSFILGLLDDPEFKEKLAIDHLGINAFKELGKKLFKDTDIQSLSDADHETVKQGMFQDTQQGTVKSKTFNGLDLRIARMFFPTMSDKSAMLSLTTAVLELKNKHFTLGDNVVIDNQVKEFLFSQLIEPELKRITEHHRKANSLGIDANKLVNQKGYNMAAQLFNFIPAMNNVMYTQQNGEKIRLIEFLAGSAHLITPDVYTKIKESIKEESYTVLDKLFNKQLADKLASWETAGYIERSTAGEINKVKFLDNTFLNSKQGTLDDKVKVAALDYIINSAVTNANMHMLIAGDIANYSQDKAFKKSVLDQKPYMPVNDEVYANMFSDVIGVNLGKRLAMLIAPGATISQSKGDKYVQLFLQDRVSASENIEFLIELYHGKSALAQHQADLDLIKSSYDVNAVGRVAEAFPELAAYLEIESTDAQEYTTAKEHLDILFRQGRVPVDQYNEFKDKIKRQQAAEAKGEVIPEDALLTDDQLKLIFQPIKPVYTGQLQDTKNDVSRMMYIKSSSFPLLPQTTLAFKGLNSLRKDLEKVEKITGKNVRASYDTANKVGAVLASRQLKVWDAQGNYIEGSINANDIHTKLQAGDDNSALILDREFFRIQQDVPFKSSKHEHMDTNTVGTQMMKLMFGNGIAQISDNIFTFNGKPISGEKLYTIYNGLFDKWISGEKTKLYNSLGIDENTGEAIDKSKTVQKLQNILQQEAKKRGYPKQDIEALELDNEGNLKDNIQFTIPLWLSPNSNRYEALLNAIVTSRLLNLKLPGASFVAGSEEGFKTTEDIDSVDQSKVVFTEAWSGELRGTRNENGSIKTAQVLVTSKLRNNEGKLLDLLGKNEQGQYIYVNEKDNGSYVLKPEMVDSGLLSFPSFRIPTSSHVSLAQVEIVGFLPTTQGDLMIVPKNFTKQKGLDFDVDKENTYWLHHTINADGKVVPIEQNTYDVNVDNIDETIQSYNEYLDSLRDTNQEVKDLINQYRDELDNTDVKLTDIDRLYTKNLIAELNKEINKKDIKAVVQSIKDLEQLRTQLIQNDIIKIYSSVLSSSDSRIQEKINKVLSTDFAEGQANLIEQMTKGSVDNSMFTTLSDEYNKAKMALGAAGKLGIGVYSNYVVLHALIQQSQTGNPIRLMKEIIDPEGKKQLVPYAVNIGGVQSEGFLGRIETLDESRSISDVLAERQNTATDNEKLQIMGKTNINEHTINVDSVMTLLGFDKDTAVINGKKTKVSIPYLLLSQPIIKDYVALMKNAKSNIAGYSATAESDVLDKLKVKYPPAQETEERDIDSAREGLTGQALVDAILDKGNDTERQQVILGLFLELKDYGDSITGVQSKLNIQRSGLGKSIFEMMDKYNNVGALAFNKKISNLHALVGDYIQGDEYIDADKNDLIDRGYILFDDAQTESPFAVKPNTVTGSLVVHAAKAGYELWSDYFPHQNTTINSTIDNIIGILAGEEVNESKKIQLQHEIFEDLKKFLFSSNKLGIYKGDAQEERARLFLDKGDNQSLASYLNGITKTNELLASNKLISKFQFQLEQGELPSLLKFDNSKSEDFNEEYKYMALVELMDKNIPLDDYNGKPYTSRMLTKDLITYAYLEGGVQEAIQYVKYIPVAYLKEMGFAGATQVWQSAAKGNQYKLGNGQTVDIWKHILGFSTDMKGMVVGKFTRQFVQHNPERLQKYTVSNVSKPFYEGKAELINLVAFTPKSEDKAELNTPKFISIYNKNIKKGKPKFQIYEFDGFRYNRISTLGVFGMSEYAVGTEQVIPLIDKPYNIEGIPVSVQPIISQPKPIDKQTPFSVGEGNLTKTLDEISKANIAGVSDMAKLLMPHIKNNTKLVTGDIRSNGTYNNNTITISSNLLANPKTTNEDVATIILHEYVHSITAGRLEQYFTPDGTLKVPLDGVPADVQRLQRLFKEVASKMAPEIEDFKAWYAKGNQGTIRNAGDRVLYAGMDIFEFTAMVMSEPAIQQKMAGITYMATEKTLIQQFFEAVTKILEKAGITFGENSVVPQAMETILSIIKEEKAPEKTSNPLSIFGGFNVMSADNEGLTDLLDKNDALDDEDIPDDFFSSPSENDNVLDQDCIF